jgi:hypothetical protein
MDGFAVGLVGKVEVGTVGCVGGTSARSFAALHPPFQHVPWQKHSISSRRPPEFQKALPVRFRAAVGATGRLPLWETKTRDFVLTVILPNMESATSLLG